ncbi:MAG: hypothetical protein ACI835_005784 [Planctomycetota bacterium]|jgi:hypothetical protein
MGEYWDQILAWGRDNLSDWTMSKIYIACAVAGGSVILGQTGLNLFGLGDGGADVDPDIDVDDLEGGVGLNFLSIRAMAGFLTFFGLVGWGGTSSQWNPIATIGAAFGAGSSVMLMVAMIMRFFKGMQSDGNIHPEGAVGDTAKVYLRIPAERSGKGKVTVNLQGRSMQFDALTAGPELPSGAECRILRMTTEGTFEVGPLD